MSDITKVTELKDYILQILEDKKAQDISVIDLRGKTALADYIIIASGTSIKHVASIADFTGFEIKHKFNRSVGIEGAGTSTWVVLDASDVIIHLFYPETRDYYQLDKIYETKESLSL